VATEQVDNGGAAEDPEILAQKLQRSKELTRRYSSALRRSQRRNRAQDLPPIYIPDWFLDRKVQLREDVQPKKKESRRKECALTIKHNESGDHGTCSIPVSQPHATMKSIAQMYKGLWDGRMMENHKAALAKDFARRMGLKDDEQALRILEKGEDPALQKDLDEERSQLLRELESVPHSEATPEKMEEKYIEHLMRQDRSASLKQPKHSEASSEQQLPKMSEYGRIPPLVIAEIRATIAASLAAMQPAINDSFPSVKTNLILHSPSNDGEKSLNFAVESIANQLGADVVTLQAQDLAQIAGDYLGEGPEPSPHSIRSLGYDTYKFGPDFANDLEGWAKEEPFDEDQDSSAEPPSVAEFPRGRPPFKPGPFLILKSIGMLKDISQNLRSNQAVGTAHVDNSGVPSGFQPATGRSQNDIQLEDLKLSTLLEALVDSNELKRSRGLPPTASHSQNSHKSILSKQKQCPDEPKLFDFSFQGEDPEIPFTSALPIACIPQFKFVANNEPPTDQPQIPERSKIIRIQDIKELNATQYGSRILQKLEDIVRKQRSAGESVMILGTTCSEELTPEMSPSGVQSLQSEGEAGFYRTIVVPQGDGKSDTSIDRDSSAKKRAMRLTLSGHERQKLKQINLRHIQDMLRRLDPPLAVSIADEEQTANQLRRYSPLFSTDLSWSAMTYDEVHRIALTAVGLHRMDPTNDQLSWAHVTLAMGLLKASDEIKYTFVKSKATEQENLFKHRYRENMARMGIDPFPAGRDSQEGDRTRQKSAKELNRIKANASKHEKKLMHGIVNAEQIKTTFDQVHVPKETKEGIRTLTSMSLLRPDAFKYGVLATEKISGALLYGPPGTGKTLLAKAVAKESGSTVLEVSGSQIMDKYVGEGEKNVEAIFSLARKLSPCIVFLDEADAIFGTRDSGRERVSHRDILNQFLKEWDGLSDATVFVMVATNRPFDMDDAVIRRLPRRLLVDLPTQEDRKEILKIHLKGEQLDSSVDLDDLAKRTPLYSGSDLKNVAVFAALACVREENEQASIAAAKAAASSIESNLSDSEPDAVTASSSTPSDENPPTSPSPILVQGLKYDFPERRILHIRHFDKALQEVSASISENMSSLNAIKKFDEQYGDRKGRRKKKSYGFGVGGQSSEDAARVRT
jgi:SpoVK/Ycf46/Vps4 family AAA+-type ATPase